MEHCVIRSSTRLLQYAALLYSISSYRCRGTVWAVPPDARGKIFDTKKNRYVVTEVSLNTVDENAIKDRILHAVWDLWTSHAEAIYRAMYGAFARAAADITPQIAAQIYAEQREREMAEINPQGRNYSAELMSGLLVFLLSDSSSFVNGQIIACDGGWNSGHFTKSLPQDSYR